MRRMEVDNRISVMSGMDDGLVNAGDFFSEESSFYGSEHMRSNLEECARSYDPGRFWDVGLWNLQCLAAQHAVSTPRGMKRKREMSSANTESIAEQRLQAKSVSTPVIGVKPNILSHRPYNPYEGQHSAKQLSETVEDFLSRMAPSKTGLASAGPWIWVANPLSKHRPTNEDIAGFKQEGSKALADYLSKKAELEQKSPEKGPGSITRMLKPDRVILEQRLTNLAHHHRVTCGKWMLFPTPEDVDAVWSTIARAVVKGELGCSAKVATDDGNPNDRQRLICVYTDNFFDLQDVKRVLRKLSQLGMTSTTAGDDRPIYYKCDAYTYLDITSGNEYKLKASMYSSKELLSEMSTWRTL